MNVTTLNTDSETRIRFTDSSFPNAIAVASRLHGDKLWSVFGINENVSEAIRFENGARRDNKFSRQQAERIACLWLTKGQHILGFGE